MSILGFVEILDFSGICLRWLCEGCFSEGFGEHEAGGGEGGERRSVSRGIVCAFLSLSSGLTCKLLFRRSKYCLPRGWAAVLGPLRSALSESDLCPHVLGHCGVDEPARMGTEILKNLQGKSVWWRNLAGGRQAFGVVFEKWELF